MIKTELYGPQLFDGNTGETSLAEFAAPIHVVELTPYYFFTGTSDFAAEGISVGTATAFPVDEDLPDDPCAPCVEAAACFVEGEFQPDLIPFGCGEACICAPCFAASEPACDALVNPVTPTPEPTSYPTDPPEENPLCEACTDTCDGGPEDCAAMEQLVAVGGCANSCLDTQEALDACIKPSYDEMQCTADDFVLAVNGDEVTEAPTDEPSSTSKMSATFGLLVAMASVAIMR